IRPPGRPERRHSSDRRTAAEREARRVELSPDSPLLFEVSWEICAQAGGIYTVLRSKAPAAVRQWGEGYWAIGPYRETAAKIEFEPHQFDGPVGDAVHELHERGIHIHMGRWLITGRPKVLLIDVSSASASLNEMKYFLWKDHGVSTYGPDPETDPI